MSLWMFCGVSHFFCFCGFNSVTYPNPANVCFLLFLIFPPFSCATAWTSSIWHLGLFFWCTFYFEWVALHIFLGFSLFFFFFLRVGSETVSACGKHLQRSSPCLETSIAARVWKDDYASDVLPTWCVTSWCGTVSSRLRLHCPQMTATDRKEPSLNILPF